MSARKYKLEILKPAQHELEEIALIHMELAGIESAQKVTDRIYNALQNLQSQPHMGVLCSNKMLSFEDYRMLICDHYLCIYRLIEQTVYVYHIVDGRTNYPRMLEDLL